MSDFIGQITQAGINAAANASNGIQLQIGFISVGTSGYTPSRNVTRLLTEVDRVSVHSEKKLGNGQREVVGQFTDGVYNAREIGFHLNDAAKTLFCVISHPSDVLFYKTATTTIYQPFTLALGAFDDAVQFASNTEHSFINITEFLNTAIATTRMSTVQIKTVHQQMQLSEKIRALMEA